MERALEMKGIMRDSKVGVFEFSRFSQEFEVICLMLIICVWGSTSEDVPITDEDFQSVSVAINGLCAAGWAEDGQGVIDTAKRLLIEGTKSRQFPLSVTLLLATGFEE